MPYFSNVSKKQLLTCHTDLQKLFNLVIKYFDCTIVEGQRTLHRQRSLYNQGLSKTLESKHLTKPKSLAVDVVPYPIDWDDIARMQFFGGFVLGMADSLGINLRWGGDWDSDTQLKDQRWNDLAHFELKE